MKGLDPSRFDFSADVTRHADPLTTRGDAGDEARELTNAHLGLLAARQHLARATEAWALAASRPEDAKTDLKAARRQRDEAHTAVARLTARVEELERSTCPGGDLGMMDRRR